MKFDRNSATEKSGALAKQRPIQLSLFQTFLPEDDKYSNTIEFYDAIPKYLLHKGAFAIPMCKAFKNRSVI